MNIAIIPAAGKGIRFGEKIPKQFILLKGKPIIVHTLEKFEKHPEIHQMVVVTSKAFIPEVEKLRKKFKLKKLVKIVGGGRTRQESVFNGVFSVETCEEDIFLVHDAVRPFVSEKLISKLLEKIKEGDAVIPVLPVRDTLIRAKEGRVVEKINRDEMFLVQTPQVIKAEILKKCLKKAKDLSLEFTDESTLLLHFGIHSLLIEGEIINFKITYKEDLILAEKLISG